MKKNNKIFVTGFHRAGTHSYAKHLNKKTSLPYIEESVITWDNWNEVMDLCEGFLPQVIEINGVKQKTSIRDKRLDRGFILQCPGLAHKVQELSKIGKVYWMTRDNADVATSMHNNELNDMVWHLMNGFHDQFPEDPVWDKLDYDGSDDVFYGFVDYYALFIKVKEYFHKKKFKSLCESKKLEEQDYFKEEKTDSFKNPLSKLQLDRVIKRIEVDLQ